MPLPPIVLKGQAKILEPIVTLFMALYTLIEEKDIGSVYGIPSTAFQSNHDFEPQVKLMFYQSKSDVIDDNSPVTGEITFRIKNEDYTSYTPAKALLLAERIKSKFVTGNVFLWHKGRTKVVYLDKKKGYDFRLLVTDETEGRRIIEQVLDLQRDTPDWELLGIVQRRKIYSSTRDRKLIYGAIRKTPLERPVETIPFRYAELHVWGIPDAVTLVDTTGFRPSPLVVS